MCTRTPVIFPPTTRTVMPAPGSASLPPSAGVITSRAVLAAAVVVGGVDTAGELAPLWPAP